MDPFRLKMKIGLHEFEAEGDQETVERQFAVWREMIASPSGAVPLMASPPPPLTPAAAAPLTVAPAAIVPPPPSGELTRADYDKIFHQAGHLVSLTIRPVGDQAEADAALLMLLGQKVYHDRDLVTGARLLDGMKISGFTSVERADRALGGHLGENVIRSGANRGVTYRMTHPGFARAKEIARALLAMVP